MSNKRNKNPFRIYEDFRQRPGDAFAYWFYKLKNLAISRYEWVNLPKEIEPVFVEETLFYNPMGIFIVDDITGIPAFMNVNLSGEMDVYDFPIDRMAYASNGYLEWFGKENSVLVRDNPAMFPTCYSTRIYAERLNNLWRTIDLNVFAQRTPVVMGTTQDNRLSYKIFGEKYENYIPVIEVSDALDLDKIKAFKLDAPYVADKLQDQIRVTISQYLTDLGYNSNGIEKRERLVSKETESNNGEIEAGRNIGLMLRKRACNACNELFGWNMDVRFRSELLDEFNESLQQATLDNINNGKDPEPDGNEND